MRMKLSVQFQGEEGIDAGGVSREWYQVCSHTAKRTWLSPVLHKHLAISLLHKQGCMLMCCLEVLAWL